MKSTILAAAAALASTALCANIPSILPLPAPNTTLIVSFGDITIANPGRTLTRPQTTPQPIVSLPPSSSLTNNTTYLLLFIDPSINTTDPTRAGLHEIGSDLHLSPNLTLISSAATQLAPYVYPQVPSTAGLSLHSYTLLLFQQPANLTIPSAFASFLPYPTSLISRVGFPMLDFIQQVGLGNPVAANWFLEGAYTANATTSSSASPSTAPARSSTTVSGAVPSSTSPSPSPSPATGAAASTTTKGAINVLAMILAPALACIGGVLYL